MRRTRIRTRLGEQGFSLLETLIASLVFLVGATGILGLITTAALMNASHGAQGTRATEYASAKMEQLMALQFGDIVSDTRAMQTANSGGTGLGGSTASTTYPSGGNLVAGTCANTSYCDYIIQGTSSDSVATSSSGAAYMRQWQIVVDSTGNIKTVTVLVTPLLTMTRIVPSTTLISQRTSY
jgi:Tfp pilus assembly protein PilV